MLDAVVGMVDQDRILAQVGVIIRCIGSVTEQRLCCNENRAARVRTELCVVEKKYIFCSCVDLISQRIADEGRACVIALNKWDAIEEKDDTTYLKGNYDACFFPIKILSSYCLLQGTNGSTCFHDKKLYRD